MVVFGNFDEAVHGDYIVSRICKGPESSSMYHFAYI